MKAYQRIRLIFMMGLSLILLVGCIMQNKTTRSSNQLGKDLTRNPQSMETSEEGSLWSSMRPVNLYSDVKARYVGDIVTISIVESAQASKNATTKTQRASGLEANWTGIFESALAGFSINGQPISSSNSIDFANNFDGQGTTTRTSQMTAFITARVIKTLPNGQLVIAGSREVQLNNENQFIYLEGVIRPEDISSNNVVLSTFIADAHIELNGSGPVSDKQRPGWLARIMDWAWPF